jgi:hypothetical protein
MKTSSQSLAAFIPALALVSAVAMAQTSTTTGGTGYGASDTTSTNSTDITPNMGAAWGTTAPMTGGALTSPLGTPGATPNTTNFGVVPGTIQTNTLDNSTAGAGTTLPMGGTSAGSLSGSSTDLSTSGITSPGTNTGTTGFGGTSGSSSSGTGSGTGQ